MALFKIQILVDGKPWLLGYISAKHQPAALAMAWRKWLDHIKADQPQAGFSVTVDGTGNNA